VVYGYRHALADVVVTVVVNYRLLQQCLAMEVDNGGQRAMVKASIHRCIRRHACDGDLDVARISRALDWSTRDTEQVLHAAHTTSRDLIRHERLRLAQFRLASPGWRHCRSRSSPIPADSAATPHSPPPSGKKSL
jgi:hypothetical protein